MRSLPLANPQLVSSPLLSSLSRLHSAVDNAAPPVYRYCWPLHPTTKAKLVDGYSTSRICRLTPTHEQAIRVWTWCAPFSARFEHREETRLVSYVGMLALATRSMRGDATGPYQVGTFLLHPGAHLHCSHIPTRLVDSPHYPPFHMRAPLRRPSYLSAPLYTWRVCPGVRAARGSLGGRGLGILAGALHFRPFHCSMLRA